MAYSSLILKADILSFWDFQLFLKGLRKCVIYKSIGCHSTNVLYIFILCLKKSKKQNTIPTTQNSIHILVKIKKKEIIAYTWMVLYYWTWYVVNQTQSKTIKTLVLFF